MEVLLQTTVKVIVVGGVLMASAGLFLPDRLAIPVVFFVSFFAGGATCVSVIKWESRPLLRGILMLIASLILSAWASLILGAACNVLSNSFQCSADKLRGLIFENFAASILILIAIWIQIIFYRK
jgi:hypothetical protein